MWLSVSPSRAITSAAIRLGVVAFVAAAISLGLLTSSCDLGLGGTEYHEITVEVEREVTVEGCEACGGRGDARDGGRGDACEDRGASSRRVVSDCDVYTDCDVHAHDHSDTDADATSDTDADSDRGDRFHRHFVSHERAQPGAGRVLVARSDTGMRLCVRLRRFSATPVSSKRVTTRRDSRRSTTPRRAFSCTPRKTFDLEVVFVLDFTNSMAQTQLPDGRNGIEAMIDAFESALHVLPSAHRIGVVEFHDRNADPSVLSALTTDREAIRERVLEFHRSGFDPGASRVWDAVTKGIGVFSRFR